MTKIRIEIKIRALVIITNELCK